MYFHIWVLTQLIATGTLSALRLGTALSFSLIVKYIDKVEHILFWSIKFFTSLAHFSLNLSINMQHLTIQQN